MFPTCNFCAFWNYPEVHCCAVIIIYLPGRPQLGGRGLGRVSRGHQLHFVSVKILGYLKMTLTPTEMTGVSSW